MVAVLEVTFPVFAVVAMGFAAARSGLLRPEAVTGLNTFVFWFALPAMLIRAIAQLPLREVIDPRFLLAYLVAAFGMFCFTWAIQPRVAGLDRTARALNATHGNVGYLGLPLGAQLASTLGDDRLIAPIIMLLIVDILFLIVPAMVLFEWFRARGTVSSGAPNHHSESSVSPSLAGTLRKVIPAVLRSPLIGGIAVGIALSLTGWQPPVAIHRLIDLVASAAAPCALFAIGAAFGADRVRPTATVWSQVGLKLIAYPAVCAVAFLLAGADPRYAAIGVVGAALPAASNTFILGRIYGADTRVISTAMVFGTALAAVTVSGVIALYDLAG